MGLSGLLKSDSAPLSSSHQPVFPKRPRFAPNGLLLEMRLPCRIETISGPLKLLDGHNQNVDHRADRVVKMVNIENRFLQSSPNLHHDFSSKNAGETRFGENGEDYRRSRTHARTHPRPHACTRATKKPNPPKIFTIFTNST